MAKRRNKDKVLFLTTGGTIEKTYDESDGSLMNRKSIIRKYILERLRRPYTDLELINVLNVDSLHMTDEHRQLLLAEIQKQQSQNCPMVILHGTDTMEITAAYIEKMLPNPEFPIVFTGAMKPVGFIDTDATQNVTEALIVSKVLPPGVYISFHNQVFPASKATKNRKRRTFEFIDE